MKPSTQKPEKKAVLIRIDSQTHMRIAAMAKANKRSVSAQVSFLLIGVIPPNKTAPETT